MRRAFFFLMSIVLITGLSSSLYAQFATRTDAIWARNTTEDIVLDGILDEASWAMAESLQIIYGQPVGWLLPTSGFRNLHGDPNDPTNAIVKFLAKNNQLYVAMIVPDSSIGGQTWNDATTGWDGFLGQIKNASSPNRPVPHFELMLSWINTDTIANPVGTGPRYGFNGPFREQRTPEDIARWDAGVVINGTTNEDSEADTSYIFEFRFNLDSLGYNTTQPEGDIVAFNFSIWDVDWFSGPQTNSQFFSRTFWQSPWGNGMQFNQGRVHVQPDVTTTSGTLPVIPPDVVYPNMANFDDPVINGELDEEAWQHAYTFEIGWGDEDIRNTYPGIGKIMSGQFQPTIGGNPRPPVVDPSHAEVKIFHKGTDLYISAVVDDQIVKQNTTPGFPDFVDGINFIVNNRNILHPMNFYVNSSFIVYFDTLGNAAGLQYMNPDSGYAEFAVTLRGTTTVGDSSDIDEGYIVEAKIDLTALGYSSTLDDRLLFMGVDLYDADNFEIAADNYGTRTWWFKENNDNGPLPWGVLNPNPLGVEDENFALIPTTIQLYGNYPNPFNPSTKIKYSVPESGNVTITIFNSIGQEIENITAFNTAGANEINYNASSLASGIYFYKVSLDNPGAQRNYQSKTGKIILLK